MHRNAPASRPDKTDSSVRPVVAALLALLLIAASAGPAAGDTKAEQEKVRDKKAEVAKDVDTLNATTEEVQTALNALEQKVTATESKLVAAQSASKEAEDNLEAAKVAEKKAEEEVAAMQDAVNELAVNAFVAPPGGGVVETLESNDLSEAALKRTFIDVRSERDFDVLDQLTKAQSDLESARTVAENVSAEADDALAAVDSRFAEVKTAQEAQAAVVADVEARLNHKLSEASALEDLDKELSAQLQKEQEELAAFINAKNKAREEAQAKAAASAPRRAAPSSPSAPTAPSAPPVVSIPSAGGMCTAGGITVSCSISGNLERMLNAARAAGHSFAGSGLRSSARQEQLRVTNGCPDVYSSPASSCRVPTAIPGRSMHEKGLAIDFTYNGSLIRSRGSAGFQWLSANAASYGLYNLPSEPWHWSVNGR